jgi:hypothetical protein
MHATFHAYFMLLDLIIIIVFGEGYTELHLKTTILEFLEFRTTIVKWK